MNENQVRQFLMLMEELVIAVNRVVQQLEESNSYQVSGMQVDFELPELDINKEIK